MHAQKKKHAGFKHATRVLNTVQVYWEHSNIGNVLTRRMDE